MKTFLTILVVPLVLGGGWYLFNNQKETGNMNNMEGKQAIVTDDRGEGSGSMEMKEDVPVSRILMDNSNSLIAVLEDVSGGDSEGTGYILREGGTLYHYVSAKLPEPQGNNKYEGWLVKQKPELMFFSTGVMESSSDGIYELSYTSEDISEGFDFVVLAIKNNQ
jgi:hypothetical protein